MDDHRSNKGSREALARWAMIALTGFALFNGLALSFGLFDALSDHNFVVRLILSLGGGAAIAALIGFGWKMLVGSAVAGNRDWQTATLGGVAGICGITVSAWILATTIGGDEALQAHRSANLDALNVQATRIERNGQLDQIVSDSVFTAAVEVLQMAKAETVNGLVSGIKSGRGQWALTLEAFATTLAEAGNEMRGVQDKRADLLKLFNKTAIEARFAASADDGARYEELAIKSARLLGDADRLQAYPKVSTLGAGIMVTEAGAEIAKTKTKLLEYATNAEAQWRRGEIPFYRPVSKHVATADQAGAVPGSWLIGVAFEILPLLLLCMILVRPRDSEGIPEPPMIKPMTDTAAPQPINDDVVTKIARSG
ncbi:MAG: hypothetical protein V4574_06660 [Pseudomonadota bacterium]